MSLENIISQTAKTYIIATTLVIIYKKSPTEMADMVGQVLHFLYFNQRALNPENVQTLLEAANYFQVRLVLSVG